MWPWLRRKLGLDFARRGKAPVAIEPIERAALLELIYRESQVAQVDWEKADRWIAERTGDPKQLRRAIAAAWFDLLSDELPAGYGRWRHEWVEGISPTDEKIGPRVVLAADRLLDYLSVSFRPLRDTDAVPEIGIIAFDTQELYYSFIAAYYPERGRWGTSQAVYLNDEVHSFPIVAMQISRPDGIEPTLAHELTHHLLHEFDIPIWAEEGLTQYLEEKSTGVRNFVLNRDSLDEQRACWSRTPLATFWSGDSFQSPTGNVQQMSYLMSQILVRRLLDDDQNRFFAFCKSAIRADGGRAAAKQHLGIDLEDLLLNTLGDGPWMHPDMSGLPVGKGMHDRGNNPQTRNCVHTLHRR